MKSHARNVAWLLLPLFLTACSNKPHQPQIQQYAPPISTVPKPPPLHPDLPESATVLPTEPLDTDTDALLDEAAKPVVRRRKPVAKPPAEAPDNATNTQTPPATQQADNDSSEVPAIGVLSSGDPPDMRQETEDSIAATERGLKSLGRALNNQEQKTASQIREYIREAKKALNSGDVEGAHTLAAKAKAILTELSE